MKNGRPMLNTCKEKKFFVGQCSTQTCSLFSKDGMPYTEAMRFYWVFFFL